MQLCKDGCLEGLTQLQAHLAGLSVSMRPPLALARAEGGRTVLTVHQGPVREGSGPGAPDLGQEGRMSQARPSQLTPALPLTPTSTSTAALPPNTARGRGGTGQALNHHHLCTPLISSNRPVSVLASSLPNPFSICSQSVRTNIRSDCVSLTHSHFLLTSQRSPITCQIKS